MGTRSLEHRLCGTRKAFGAGHLCTDHAPPGGSPGTQPSPSNPRQSCPNLRWRQGGTGAATSGRVSGNTTWPGGGAKMGAVPESTPPPGPAQPPRPGASAVGLESSSPQSSLLPVGIMRSSVRGPVVNDGEDSTDSTPLLQGARQAEAGEQPGRLGAPGPQHSRGGRWYWGRSGQGYRHPRRLVQSGQARGDLKRESPFRPTQPRLTRCPEAPPTLQGLADGDGYAGLALGLGRCLPAGRERGAALCGRCLSCCSQ